MTEQNKSILKLKSNISWKRVEPQDVDEMFKAFQKEDEILQNQEIKEFNHSYYQGLLLTIGNLKDFKTFAPNQDKNKLFVNEKLGDLRTLSHLPEYSYKHFVARSSTIDVIWFNEREMPDSFFEVEHSTDIQNSLEKFNDLRDFYAKMYIVADENRFAEYEKKMEYTSFTMLKKKRKGFLS